ncbi:MAG: aminopeptidase P family protein [Proteobacteria bacterium]|nr:aminopeptidase P family protein [Pseudomonadota bacterium]
MAGDGLTAQKWARLREHMRRDGLAAVVLGENGRSRYLTGYQRYYTAAYLPSVHAAVMTLDAGPVLLLPRHVLATAATCQAERAVEFPLAEDGRVETLARTLSDLGAGRGRIGVEFDFLHHGFAAKLVRRLKEAELVDAAPLMGRVMAVKFAEEIELLRGAARMSEVGLAAAIEAIREGASELEVGARSSAAMLEAGAEFINHMCVRSGPHAVGLYPVNTARAIARGDCVQLDIGCLNQGYVADINRTVVVGRASPEQRRLLEVGQEMLEAGIAAVRAGVTAGAVARACNEVAARAGMADRVTIPFSGHGLGLGLHEEPYVYEGAGTVLEEDMVIALEPGVYAAGIGGSRPEDTLRVTATGCELLSHFPRDYDLLEG